MDNPYRNPYLNRGWDEYRYRYPMNGNNNKINDRNDGLNSHRPYYDRFTSSSNLSYWQDNLRSKPNENIVNQSNIAPLRGYKRFAAIKEDNRPVERFHQHHPSYLYNVT